MSLTEIQRGIYMYRREAEAKSLPLACFVQFYFHDDIALNRLSENARWCDNVKYSLLTAVAFWKNDVMFFCFLAHLITPCWYGVLNLPVRLLVGNRGNQARRRRSLHSSINPSHLLNVSCYKACTAAPLNKPNIMLIHILVSPWCLTQ